MSQAARFGVPPVLWRQAVLGAETEHEPVEFGEAESVRDRRNRGVGVGQHAGITDALKLEGAEGWMLEALQSNELQTSRVAPNG